MCICIKQRIHLPWSGSYTENEDTRLNSAGGRTHYYAFNKDLKLLYRIRQDVTHTHLLPRLRHYCGRGVERLYEPEAVDHYKEIVNWTQKGNWPREPTAA